jgi:hypothetical protein
VFIRQFVLPVKWMFFSALVVCDIISIRIYSYRNLAASRNKLVDKVHHNEL